MFGSKREEDIMRKFGAIAAGLAVVAAMGSGVRAADAGAGAAPETIHVVEKVVESTLLDLGTSGPSQGDGLILRGRLFDEAGEKVGADGQSCTQTSASGQFHCSLTLRLPGGQIATQGLLRIAETSSVHTLAITGGTGEFAGVGGQIRLEQVTDEEAEIVISLIHPAGV